MQERERVPSIVDFGGASRRAVSCAGAKISDSGVQGLVARNAAPSAAAGWRKADPIPQKKKAPDLWHAARCATPRPTVGDVLEPFRLFCRMSISWAEQGR